MGLDLNGIIISVIGALGVIIAAVVAYRKDVRVKQLESQLQLSIKEMEKRDIHSNERSLKLGALDRLLDFQSFNEIRDSVDRMFINTKADRFMIIIAMNGIHDFRIISVIFEQHKSSEWKVNAIIRYRDVEIDQAFKNLLKRVESEGIIDLKVSEMNPQLLKDFYTIEQVKYSKLRFLHREHIDDKNDVVIYSTIATHIDEPFTTLENAIIKTEYEGSILHTIKTYL